MATTIHAPAVINTSQERRNSSSKARKSAEFDHTALDRDTSNRSMSAQLNFSCAGMELPRRLHPARLATTARTMSSPNQMVAVFDGISVRKWWIPPTIAVKGKLKLLPASDRAGRDP